MIIFLIVLPQLMLALFGNFDGKAFAFSVTKKNVKINNPISSSAMLSTPFDASLYDEKNPILSELSPLSTPPSTKLVLGLNKYSHVSKLLEKAVTDYFFFGELMSSFWISGHYTLCCQCCNRGSSFCSFQGTFNKKKT